ncbi:hypothetical protein J5N97_012923 [Dioscorea zingiberensis]|uniref:Uncharacterized protein n=1 Tax=Dioscorea zingiberensis TaxID=325984 RepID=A0A9D5HI91_9LILI|nr:hypothetical protein J5N97_012923 [Dioscorea zingiberensis]
MFGFAPYDAYWRAMRKITLSNLLSLVRLNMPKHVPTIEVDTCMKELFALCSGDRNPNIGKDIEGYVKAMMKASKEMDGVMDGLLEEHRRRRACGEVNEHPDFMDLMLSNIIVPH